MDYLTLKALHLIFVVTWFAGLFYIVRLYIYDIEARARPEPEARILTSQFAIMERRLWYGITVPSAIATLLLGTTLAVLSEAWRLPWFHVKVAFLGGLYAYHFHCGALRKQLGRGACRMTSRGLRLHNEVATLFLVAIVPLAVTKDLSSPVRFGVGFTVFAGVVFGLLARARRREGHSGNRGLR